MLHLRPTCLTIEMKNGDRWIDDDDDRWTWDPLCAGDEQDGDQEQHARDPIVQLVHLDWLSISRRINLLREWVNNPDPALWCGLDHLLLSEDGHVLPDGAEQTHHGRHDASISAQSPHHTSPSVFLLLLSLF